MNRPTSTQFRMARASLDWSVDKVVEETGLSYQTILNAESDHPLREGTVRELRGRYESAGLEFTANEGVRRRQDDIQDFFGDDAYLNMLDDVIAALQPTGGEVLFSGSDERRSTPAVNNKLRQLRAAGISMRSLITMGNRYYLGPRTEYRCIDERFVAPGDVTAIYSDKVAFFLSSEVPQRVRSIRSLVVAEDYRRKFEFMWINSRMPEESEADERY